MQMLLFSVGAGIIGMGIGGLLSALLLKRASDNITCWLLSFAAGIMTSIVCFGLLPEAIELSGVTASISGLIIGIVIILLLNKVVDKFAKLSGENMQIHHTHEELYHQGQVIHSRTKLLQSGIIMLTAISLHNIPEGIAIGAGGSHDFSLGALIALMVTLHNLPEGMAVAAPLLAGGMRRWKAVLWTTISGAPTVLGALIGILIGNVSDFAVAVSLAAAGGAMLYVVFGEIIPQSVVMTKSRIAPLVTLFGLLMGLLITRVG
jgi:ZIP family zinc transporter